MGKADYVLIINFYRLRSSSLFSFRWWRHRSSAKNGRKWWSPFQCCSPPILQLNDNKSYSTCKILHTTFVNWSYVWRNLPLESYSRVIKQAKKMYRNTILVYRRAHVHQKLQFCKCQQSHATDKKRMYAKQEIFQTHHLCSCFMNINQSAGNISKDNSNTENLIYSLFKTTRVSR